jgi:serine/threonine protein kinase
MIGNKILNYTIISLIGEGGMGSVYLAEHSQMNRKVAIKVLHPQYTKIEEIKVRFKNEASTMAHLQHPNIVTLLDYIEDETGMYLIMEFIQGTPLDEYILNKTGPMPEEKAVPIMLQVLSAFSYAHAQKVVHRDIKPANIIVCDDGTVKILDFGIARLLGEGNQNLTKTGTQMGTVFYMSPEQVQGKKVDHRSDIYSLGVTFYQMLTGVNPYKGLTTDYEVYSRIVKEDLPDPLSVYPGVPEYFKQILDKALAKDIEKRFQNCDEFSLAIKEKNIPKSTNPDSKIAQDNVNKQKTVQVNVTKSNSNSTASLVLGILALITSFLPVANILSLILAIIAIVLGFKGIKNARLYKEFEGTAGGAKAGRILGFISLAIIAIVYLVIYISFLNKDSDYDGVPDRRDNCMWVFGNTNDGCPDQDLDGVYDEYDNCPELYGSPENNGCPDSDGDGVYDNEDQCPEEMGSSENSGCPWIDSDEDGLNDDEDNCPEEYGPSYNSGCPQGQGLFWFDNTHGSKWGGDVSIYVDGQYVGKITNWYSTAPECGASGCVTIDRYPGTYSWRAESENGNYWDGTVTIQNNDCTWNSIWIN